jgi:hypothetical protein
MPNQRLTIYDMMDAKGYFATNPANPGSRDSEGKMLYAGPVEYPKMFYHPNGETKLVDRGTLRATLVGPEKINTRLELVSQIAHGPEEEAELRAAGWHDTPGKAIVAGGGDAPPEGPMEAKAKLEAEVVELRKQLAEAQAGAKLPMNGKGTGLAPVSMPAASPHK